MFSCIPQASPEFSLSATCNLLVLEQFSKLLSVNWCCKAKIKNMRPAGKQQGNVCKPRKRESILNWSMNFHLNLEDKISTIYRYIFFRSVRVVNYLSIQACCQSRSHSQCSVGWAGRWNSTPLCKRKWWIWKMLGHHGSGSEHSVEFRGFHRR